MERGEPRLAPLVLATMASQALLVVLAPTIVAIGDDLGASVGAVGQARSISAGVAIAASIAIAGRIDTLGVPRLLGLGAALAIIACAAIALSPTLAMFLVAHVLVGLAFACLLSAGFAGVAAFVPARRAWAIGYVAGANALAWIVVNPIVGVVTDWLSWRVAQAVPGAIAVAALVAARAPAPAPSAPAAKQLRTLLAERSARRWIGSELIAYGAWTSLLTFVGAFFIERFGVPEAAVGSRPGPRTDHLRLRESHQHRSPAERERRGGSRRIGHSGRSALGRRRPRPSVAPRGLRERPLGRVAGAPARGRCASARRPVGQGAHREQDGDRSRGNKRVSHHVAPTVSTVSPGTANPGHACKSRSFGAGFAATGATPLAGVSAGERPLRIPALLYFGGIEAEAPDTWYAVVVSGGVELARVAVPIEEARIASVRPMIPQNLQLRY